MRGWALPVQRADQCGRAPCEPQPCLPRPRVPPIRHRSARNGYGPHRSERLKCAPHQPLPPRRGSPRSPRAGGPPRNWVRTPPAHRSPCSFLYSARERSSGLLSGRKPRKESPKKKEGDQEENTERGVPREVTVRRTIGGAGASATFGADGVGPSEKLSRIEGCRRTLIGWTMHRRRREILLNSADQCGCPITKPSSVDPAELSLDLLGR